MNALLNVLEKLHLNTKLVVGFSFGILIALIIGLYALSGLTRMESELTKMFEVELLGISHIKEANLNLIYISRAMRQMLIAQDDRVREQARAQIKRAREMLMIALTESRQRMHHPKIIERYEQFQTELARYFESIEYAISLVEREPFIPSPAAIFMTSQEFLDLVARADGSLHELTALKQRTSDDALELAQSTVSNIQWVTGLLLVLGTLIALAAGMLIGASIKRPHDRLRLSIEALASGAVDASIPHVDYRNEIGVSARAIQVLQTIYRKANDLHWVKSCVSEIATALLKTEDFQILAHTAISRLAPLVGAGHGAFYVVDEEGYFNLLASYGYRERKGLNHQFRTGEGLVGQCALERTPILLSAPRDYIRINSGLGEGPPASIMVLPIIHSGRVLGVLEMASFQMFTERQQAVLEAVISVLATNMEILDRNLRTQELLRASREQAERMEKQAAQLEEQAVEMEAQQAELLETENWFRGIIETAPDGMLVIDEAGIILLANPKAESLFGYGLGELASRSVDHLVPEEARPSHAHLRNHFLEEGCSRMMESSQPLLGLRKDGSRFPIAVSLNILPSRGSRGRCVSVSVRFANSHSVDA